MSTRAETTTVLDPATQMVGEEEEEPGGGGSHSLLVSSHMFSHILPIMYVIHVVTYNELAFLNAEMEMYYHR